MQTLSDRQEMQIINLKWLLFPYWSSDFIQINRNEAVKLFIFKILFIAIDWNF